MESLKWYPEINSKHLHIYIGPLIKCLTETHVVCLNKCVICWKEFASWHPFEFWLMRNSLAIHAIWIPMVWAGHLQHLLEEVGNTNAIFQWIPFPSRSLKLNFDGQFQGNLGQTSIVLIGMTMETFFKFTLGQKELLGTEIEILDFSGGLGRGIIHDNHKSPFKQILSLLLTGFPQRIEAHGIFFLMGN